jgi:hypothetical protein
MKDGGCSLTFVKVTNPNIIKEATKSPCTTYHIELKRMYNQLGAKNKCPIKVANWISIIYLSDQALSS